MAYNDQNMMQVGFILNTSVLDFYSAEAQNVALNASKATVEAIKTDIQQHWSGESPSEPGQPPAVVTGYLNDSIRVIRRDTLGRFALFGNAISWTLTVESEYGAAQEFGRPEINLAPRPYLRPALARANSTIAANVITEFKFMQQRRATGFKEFWQEFGVLPTIAASAFVAGAL